MNWTQNAIAIMEAHESAPAPKPPESQIAAYMAGSDGLRQYVAGGVVRGCFCGRGPAEKCACGLTPTSSAVQPEADFVTLEKMNPKNLSTDALMALIEWLWSRHAR